MARSVLSGDLVIDLDKSTDTRPLPNMCPDAVASLLLVLLGCVRYMAGEAGPGSWQHSGVPLHGERSLSSYWSRIRAW